MFRQPTTLLATLAIAATAAATHAAPVKNPAQLRVIGDWQVEVEAPGARPPRQTLSVPAPEPITVTDEKYDTIPVFNPNAGGWVRGVQLKGVRAQETTTPFLLDPASVIVRSTPAGEAFRANEDYRFDGDWGTLGRLAGGRITESMPVWISYRYTPLRLDTVVQTRAGKVEFRKGEPKSAAPAPPALQAGEVRLANIWLPGRVARLSPDHLFPVLETAYPEAARPQPTVAERLTPKALAKLRSGEPLKILAWGDSVTVGTYVPDYQRNRWQEQFVARLRQRFPKARIELVTEAWGGRNTSSYLAEPPGSEHNYREKVLAVKPDLVVSEFVNDAGLNPAQVEERYVKLLADFREIGAEWIILTPHYVRPDWMGINRERDVDQDPRPYVAGLRQFAPKHNVALADASLRYGRLWRQGIPYTALMLNSINHPDARGMSLFADALMELFPDR